MGKDRRKARREEEGKWDARGEEEENVGRR